MRPEDTLERTSSFMSKCFKTRSAIHLLLSGIAISHTTAFADENHENLNGAEFFRKASAIETSAVVDPESPPQHLRVQFKDPGGKPLTAFLVRTSARRADFTTRYASKGKAVKDFDPGPIRTYKGWVEALPDTMVAATLLHDGTMRISIQRAISSKGWGSKGGIAPGPYSADKPKGSSLIDNRLNVVQEKGAENFDGGKDFTFVSGKPKFEFATPYPGASFSSGIPTNEAFYKKIATVDTGVVIRADFFNSKNEKRLNNLDGYRKIVAHCEHAANNFDLMSLRCGFESLQISNVVIPSGYRDPNHKGDEGVIYTDEQTTRFLNGLKPADGSILLKYAGGGAANGLKKRKTDQWISCAISNWNHEFGHWLGWGGDNCGMGVETDLLGPLSTPAWAQACHSFGVVAVNNHKRSRLLQRENPEWSMHDNYRPLPTLPILPYAMMDDLEGRVNKDTVIDCLSNDFDVNGDDIAIADFDKTSIHGGTITFVPQGGKNGRDALRYTPKADYTGKDRFTYCIVDSAGRMAYGNIRVNVKTGQTRTLISYLSFDDVDELYELDPLFNHVIPVSKRSRLGLPWGEGFRTKPFVACWDVYRARKRYFDGFIVSVYNWFSGKGNIVNPNDRVKTTHYDEKAALAPYSNKEFSFDITGQAFLNCPDGVYDISLYRWPYSNVQSRREIKKHPKLKLHRIALRVDGKELGAMSVNSDIELKNEPIARGPYGDQFSIFRLDLSKKMSDPKFQAALKEADRLTTYFHPLPMMRNRMNGVKGPKVELVVELSKSEGLFVGGLDMTPVDKSFENLKGKFGNAVKINDRYRLFHDINRDGSAYKTLSYWFYAPTWKMPCGPKFVRVWGVSDGFDFDFRKNMMKFSDKFVNPDTQGEGRIDFPIPSAGEWHHYALVLGKKDAKVYIDGEMAGSAPRTNFSPRIGSPTTKGMGDMFFVNLNGAIDDFRVYSGVLEQKDIKTLMDGGVPEFLTPFPGQAAFDEQELSWVPCANAANQKVYIAESEDELKTCEPTATLKGSVYKFKAPIKANSSYFWRIDTKRKDGKVVPGTVWKFSTADKLYSPAEALERKTAAFREKLEEL
ncbi:LamG-like jellyroll fold domain-containing protein [Rubritalea tangerina]|uniref:LamG-like jellyroll fold domain-containing protein n=2 Tax=Rubritalea tangerina TaxID=430798 RepID=A0ABW4ZAR2_9BACT